MPNHKSSIKRHRQSLKKRDHNRTAKASVRTAVVKARAAAVSGDAVSAKAVLQEAERSIAKATSKGIFHKKNAARKISRMYALLAKGQANKGLTKEKGSKKKS